MCHGDVHHPHVGGQTQVTPHADGELIGRDLAAQGDAAAGLQLHLTRTAAGAAHIDVGHHHQVAAGAATVVGTGHQFDQFAGVGRQ